MEKFLIVDIGTSSLRAFIMDESLKIIDSRTEKRVLQECFDGEEEWQKIYHMTKALLKRHKDIRSAAVSALLSWIGTDENANAVTPCYSYMHKCENECSRFRNFHTDDEIYQICGRGINPEWAAFKILDIEKSQPEVYKKLRYFMTLKDFINFKLTGIPAIDRTSAGYTMLFDVKNGIWSKKCVSDTGIDERLLPKLKWPWEKLGDLKKELSDELEVLFPVAAGSVDGSTGILGAGGMESGTMVSVMGTTDSCFTVSDKPCGDEKHQLLVNAHVIPGKWLLGGPMGMYGGAADWLLDKVSLGAADLAEMNRMAFSVPEGSGGVDFFPTLTGEREPFWNPKVKGTVFGMTPDTKCQHLFRAIMESNSYAIRYIKDLCNICGVPAKKVIAIGGGSKSDLWLKIKADVLKTDVLRMEVSEATAAGSCMLAMLATGTTVRELNGKVKAEQKICCEEEKCRKYDALYERHMKLHDAVTEIYDII